VIMKTQRLAETQSGESTIEIRRNSISIWGLVRCLKRLPGANVLDLRVDPLNDNVSARIDYNGKCFRLYTPFSDYLISDEGADHSKMATDALFSHLETFKPRWWEKII